MATDLTIDCWPVGQMQANCYLIISPVKHEAVIVDPGDEADFINQKLLDKQLKPIYIIATHGHFDHIMAAFELQQTWNIPFLINSRDTFLVEQLPTTVKHFLNTKEIYIPPRIDGSLTEGKEIKFADNTLKIIETPGHTPGSVCMYSKTLNTLISGDTIFADGGIGRTDFNYASAETLRKSLNKIFHNYSTAQILPGHGRGSTLEKEIHFHKKYE